MFEVLCRRSSPPLRIRSDYCVGTRDTVVWACRTHRLYRVCPHSLQPVDASIRFGLLSLLPHPRPEDKLLPCRRCRVRGSVPIFALRLLEPKENPIQSDEYGIEPYARAGCCSQALF